MDNNFIKHNLLYFRDKVLQISPNSEIGRVEIAIAADMIYEGSISRAKFNQISSNKAYARLIKIALIEDMNKLLASEIIPKILNAADPTSPVAVSGVIAELASELPQPKATGFLFTAYSTATQVKTMWDIQSILDNFSRTPRMLEIIFSQWRGWRIEVDYAR